LIYSFGFNFTPYETTIFSGVIAVVLLAIHSAVNFSGVKAASILTNFGLFVEVFMTVVLGILLLVLRGSHQPISSVFEVPVGTEDKSFFEHVSMFLPALLSQAFIFFGFESAADVSEEVVNAKKEVPRAMILSLLGAAVVSFFLEFALVIAIPNSKTTDVMAIIEAHVGNTFGRIFSGLLAFSYLSCAAAIQLATTRHIFAFARDGMLPFSKFFSRVSPKSKIPVYALAYTTQFSFLVICTSFFNFSETISAFFIIVSFSVVGIYCGFQLVVFARLYAYFKNNMGYENKYMIIVPILAQIYGVLMIINLVYPRPFDQGIQWITLIVTTVVIVIGIFFSFIFSKDVNPIEQNKEKVSLLSNVNKNNINTLE